MILLKPQRRPRHRAFGPAANPSIALTTRPPRHTVRGPARMEAHRAASMTQATSASITEDCHG